MKDYMIFKLVETDEDDKCIACFFGTGDSNECSVYETELAGNCNGKVWARVFTDNLGSSLMAEMCTTGRDNG